jgi:hypothetical protein
MADGGKCPDLKQFLEEVERLCRGKRGKDWVRERDYLLRNTRAGRLEVRGHNT